MRWKKFLPYRVLEPAVIEDVKAFLASIRTADMVVGYMAKLDAAAKQYIVDLAVKQVAIPKVEFELGRLKGEIIRVLTGESTFIEKMIKELLLAKEKELLKLKDAENYLQNEILRIDTLK